MACYIVTYDLNKETVRPKIVDEVKKADGWARLSESPYAIVTSETPQQVYNRFKKLLDGNDFFLVISLREPHYGQADEDVIQWLASNLPT